MSRRTLGGLLMGALLLGVPAAARAYIVCIDVVNVYPNGTTTRCRDCQIYSNLDGSWQGEITNCGGTHGSSV